MLEKVSVSKLLKTFLMVKHKMNTFNPGLVIQIILCNLYLVK